MSTTSKHSPSLVKYVISISRSTTRPDACQSLQIGSMYQRFLVIPILSSIAFASVAHVSPDNDDGVPVCIEDRRTLLNIVWSCLATIFACTWLAVHPNVPGRNITSKGAISCAIERAKIMAVAILASKVIVAWATEQFIVAWNVCHGEYFLCLREPPGLCWTRQEQTYLSLQ